MNQQNLASFIWNVADLLRGEFKQSQYGRIILPFTLLRRLECVLADSKDNVLAEYKRIQSSKFPEDAQEKLLLRATNNLAFYNISPMDLNKIGQNNIKLDLDNYIQSFSTDAREIFQNFKFDEFIGLLDDVNLLYKVVEKFANTDLSPTSVTNYEMGLVFEELIRRFAEGSNETAGEHFTPRDIIRLTTSLVFMEDDDVLTKEGIIRTIYDPTAGTGGFLSAGMEYLMELNPKAVLRAFGQELNPESYAICKADMLIKGQDVSRIKLGNTLSNDQLANEKFDYMLSNPPYGVDWKKIANEVTNEHELRGFNGRFGPGLPRVSDGSLLFLLHLISKMRDAKESNGGRIGIILNGSPLFTGSAGSGESEIRRYILEADLLEAIIALPTDMFYNTGIATYIWILSNKKLPQRKGKVQLINAVSLSEKMRKSLGSKRNYLTEDDIKAITQAYGNFVEIDPKTIPDNTKEIASKVFDSWQFGYRRVTIERPLRLSAQITDNAIETLRFAPKTLNLIMSDIYEKFGQAWTDESYGDLKECEVEVRAFIKAEYAEIKEKEIKTLLSKDIWLKQKNIMKKAKQIQSILGVDKYDDFNHFDVLFNKTLIDHGIELENSEKKQIIEAITWRNPEAEPVVSKVLKTKENPLYGNVKYKGKVVNFEQDSDLRDYENIALNPAISTKDLIESYFLKDVAPHVPDAWINATKKDTKDDEIGVVGYEIPFNRYFYVYQPPRSLEEIDADLDKISEEIMELLKEVNS